MSERQDENQQALAELRAFLGWQLFHRTYGVTEHPSVIDLAAKMGEVSRGVL